MLWSDGSPVQLRPVLYFHSARLRSPAIPKNQRATVWSLWSCCATVVNCSVVEPALHEAEFVRLHGAGRGAVDESVFSAFRALIPMSKAPRARVIFSPLEDYWVEQGARKRRDRVPNTMLPQDFGYYPASLLAAWWGEYPCLRTSQQDS